VNLAAVFEWIMATSLMASVVVVLIGVIKRLFGDRLGPQWHYAIWFLLILRLVLPWVPETQLSIFNFDPLETATQFTLGEPGSEPDAYPQDVEPVTGLDREIPSIVEHRAPAHRRLAPSSGPDALPAAQDMRFGEDAGSKAIENAAAPGLPPIVVVWLVGACATALYLLAANMTLAREARKGTPVTAGRVLQIWDRTRQRLSAPTSIGLVETTAVRTPSLIGVVRPRLLLPVGLANQLDDAQLEHVLLHELSHWYRSDLVVNWLFTFLASLHWFNPLVWYGFIRMRDDQELACDITVLSYLGSRSCTEYGRTLLGVISARTFLGAPGVAGISSSRTQLARRVRTIAGHRAAHPLRVVFGVVLSLILAVCTLTNPYHPVYAQLLDREQFSLIGELHSVVHPAWSPDGNQLVWADKFDESTVHQVQVGFVGDEGFNVRGLASMWVYSLVWSPDSRTLAVGGNRPYSEEALWFIDVSSGQLKPVSRDITDRIVARILRPIGWLGPETVLISAHCGVGCEHLWIYDGSRVTVRPVLTREPNAQGESRSSDSVERPSVGWLSDQSSFPWFNPSFSGRVVVAGANGKYQLLWAEEPETMAPGAVESPDGKLHASIVLVQRDEFSETSLRVVDTTTEAVHTLRLGQTTAPITPARDNARFWESHIPSWSPDGRRIAVVSVTGDLLLVDCENWEVSTLARGLVQVDPAARVVSRPVWSPNGNHFYVATPATDAKRAGACSRRIVVFSTEGAWQSHDRTEVR